MSRDRYFAYGSNLEPARMSRRVPSSRALGAAQLCDFSWRMDKRGGDGSAKANIRREPGSLVWGVVYELDPGDWPALDACEGGYARIEVEVQRGDLRLGVHTYLSEDRAPDPTPFAWYKQLMLDGALHHGLPPEWISRIEALEAR